MLKIITAISFALLGSFWGNRWITKLYRQKQEILTFPHQAFSQAQKRPLYLVASLGILFTFWLLFSPTTVPITISHLLFIYFLILFTITDCEQQVIFDVMLIPFALFGLFSLLLNGLPLFDHLIAALGGGALFLLLTFLTHGGIGGGDIKLIAALGLWLGIHQLADVITMGLIAGGIGAFLLLKFKHKKKTDTFAYGPYFTITAILMLFLK
ncbi:MAG: A24 family peptidase [Selenomonas sp.]|nr:A24 family peptidase [Selenomonas sp.]